MGFDFQDMFSGYDAGTENAKLQAERDALANRENAARAAADAAAAQEKARLKAIRDAATGQARTSAQKYFSDRGLDPLAYSSDIDTQLNDLLGTISESDPTPGLYLKNLGEQAFTGAQNALRDRSGRSVDMAFSPDFSWSRIGDTTDDPILADIDRQERGKADEFIDRLLRRNVITGTGATGARANLDEQGSRVRGLLGDIGGDVLAGGRQRLDDIIGRARSTAGNLALGNQFDLGRYSSDIDTSFNDFIGNLGDTIRGQISGPLYDTSGLAAAAGAASGAQNTRFDPLALAGIEQEEEDPFGQTPKKRRATF